MAFLTISCQEEQLGPEPQNNGNGMISIGASFEEYKTPNTKASENEGKFAWEANDQINIAKTDGKFELYSTSQGGAEAVFNGADAELLKYAVYPAAIAQKVDNEVLHVTLPSTYDIKNHTTTSTPMVATFEGNKPGSLTFKHVAGLLRFKFDNFPADACKLVFSTASGITGDFKVEPDENNNYVIKSATATEGNQTVTVNFTAKGSVSNDVVFYIPVPVGDYTGYTVRIYDSENELVGFTGTTVKFSIPRKRLAWKDVSLTSVSGSIESPDIIVSSEEEVNEAYATVNASNPVLNLTAGKELDTWNLPEVFTAEGTTESALDITYSDVPSSITINEYNAESNTSAESKGVVTVKVPVNTEDEPIDVTINTPSLTVNIEPVGEGNLYLNTIQSTTAKTTLNLKSGVVVKTLNAEGGNVVVEKNSSVKALNVKAENTSVTVSGTVETLTTTVDCSIEIAGESETNAIGTIKVSDGASQVEVTGSGKVGEVKDVRENTDEPIIIVTPEAEDGESAGVIIDAKPSNSTTVTSSHEADLRAALADEATKSFDLTEDIKLTSPIIVGKEFVLNLGNHSITSNDNFAGANALITINRNGGNLTVNGDEEGTIASGTVPAAIMVTGSTDGIPASEITIPEESKWAKLTVNGGNISGFYYAIMGNGSRHGSEVMIAGGKLTATRTAGNHVIFHPQYGKLTISGSPELTAQNTAIEMRSGILRISGGSFTSTGTPYDQYGNNSGSTIYGAAIGVSQHTTDQTLSVAISGGTFNGVYALYEKDLENETGRDNISLSVTGGTFNGIISSENESNFISGGQFSHPSAFDYLSSAAEINVTLQENVTVDKQYKLTGKSVTLNLNNKTLTFDDEKVNDIFIRINDGLTFISEGSGTINSDDYIFSVNEGGTLYIKGDGNYNALYECTCVNVNGGKAYIQGGRYSVCSDTSINKYGTKYLLNKIDATSNTSVISVSGGTFVNYDPADVYADPEQPISYLADGYISYKSSDTEYSVIDADEISTAAQLEAGIKQGASLKLTEDITVAGLQIPEGKDITVDLNTKTLTTTAQSRVSGKITLKNGKIEDCIGGIALYKDGAELHMDGVTYKAPEEGQGVFNAAHTLQGVIDIKNSELNSGYFAVSTNALTDKEGTVQINLYNSKFTADETAFMVNIPTKVTVDECQFTGGWQGVLIRSCQDVTIKNSSITLDVDSNYKYANNKKQGDVWGTGNQVPSAALTMGNRSSSSAVYNHPTMVKLEKVSFTKPDVYPAVYIDADPEYTSQGATLYYDDETGNSIGEDGLVTNSANSAAIKVNPTSEE